MQFEVEERTAQLSWERKDVEVPEGMDEVEYSVLAYCDDKKDSRKVYRLVTGFVSKKDSKGGSLH